LSEGFYFISNLRISAHSCLGSTFPLSSRKTISFLKSPASTHLVPYGAQVLVSAVAAAAAAVEESEARTTGHRPSSHRISQINLFCQRVLMILL
jgi:hypothetical protein